MTLCSNLHSELRRARPLLGTIVEITACGAAPAVLASGVEAAFKIISLLQSRLSYHDSSSELSLVNREAYRRAVSVSDSTFKLLLLAQQIHLASEACFDPVIAPLLEKSGHLPKPAQTGRVSGRAKFSDVVLLPENRVRFARALRIDLGGIAKGFAVDYAIKILQAAGVPSGLVNAGGDLRAYGHRAWPIVVRDPAMPARFHALGSLCEGAVATSAVYFSRRRAPSGRWTSAIINPLSRRPWLARASISLRAPEAATADALTKVLAIQGIERSKKLLESFGAEGWWLSHRGFVRSTRQTLCVA